MEQWIIASSIRVWVTSLPGWGSVLHPGRGVTHPRMEEEFSNRFIDKKRILLNVRPCVFQIAPKRQPPAGLVNIARNVDN